MRYLLIMGLILFGLMGCGSSSTQKGTSDQMVTPVSPTPTDKSKQPPSIPNL